MPYGRRETPCPEQDCALTAGDDRCPPRRRYPLRYIAGLLSALAITEAATNATLAENWAKGTREAVLVKQGAVRLSAAQVRALIVGRTEAAKYERSRWPVTFYSSDGMMYIRLPSGGKTMEPYKIKPDGGICYEKAFTKCHYYLRLKGELIAVRRGSVLGVATIVSGMHL